MTDWTWALPRLPRTAQLPPRLDPNLDQAPGNPVRRRHLDSKAKASVHVLGVASKRSSWQPARRARKRLGPLASAAPPPMRVRTQSRQSPSLALSSSPRSPSPLLDSRGRSRAASGEGSPGLRTPLGSQLPCCPPPPAPTSRSGDSRWRPHAMISSAQAGCALSETNAGPCLAATRSSFARSPSSRLQRAGRSSADRKPDPLRRLASTGAAKGCKSKG